MSMDSLVILLLLNLTIVVLIYFDYDNTITHFDFDGTNTFQDLEATDTYFEFDNTDTTKSSYSPSNIVDFINVLVEVLASGCGHITLTL